MSIEGKLVGPSHVQKPRSVVASNLARISLIRMRKDFLVTSWLFWKELDSALQKNSAGKMFCSLRLPRFHSLYRRYWIPFPFFFQLLRMRLPRWRRIFLPWPAPMSWSPYQPYPMSPMKRLWHLDRRRFLRCLLIRDHSLTLFSCVRRFHLSLFRRLGRTFSPLRLAY